MAASIVLRPPITSSAKVPEGLTAPSVEDLKGVWHVTHSTLPMWKKARNIRITYTPHQAGNGPVKINDNVSYQSLTAAKIKNVDGVDVAQDGGWSYKWRGKGLLMIASSKWEIMAFGKEHGSENEYAVTFFNKTLFTPAGVDFYSRAPEGLKAETVEAMKAALLSIEDETIKSLGGQIFEIKMDDARQHEVVKDTDTTKANSVVA
ncbi:hypothetical protein EJ05DRAFT_332001 [Pseudovirgaria hyperparasitica]|uniref:Uncharacterized protein n=1 Tax=Pseudovirgaria hyperparasitica TaxID=470096 RepID=A0A6A6WBU9_9PEZI|nr:uncharacterized protein EJ05DRAFT_332001 [Pseudovirgaria hyperparasitica]KAF2759077.1 hypothetical protein EJ05DRAFT_332001 [Pseudovirgaria hyperparasitica]